MTRFELFKQFFSKKNKKIVAIKTEPFWQHKTHYIFFLNTKSINAITPVGPSGSLRARQMF